MSWIIASLLLLPPFALTVTGVSGGERREAGPFQWRALEPQSRRLRNGVSHRVPLGPAQLKTFYFELKTTGSFWLYVTPCGGTIKWRLSLIGKGGAEETLVQEVGRERMSYASGEAGIGPGLVRLHFLSPYESTWVELFATDDLRRLYEHFPRLPYLPKERSLLLHNLSHSSARLSWHHSPSLQLYQHNPPLDYCLVLSPTRPIYTFCHLQNIRNEKAGGPSPEKSNRLFHDDAAPAKMKKSRGGETEPWIARSKIRNVMDVRSLRPNVKYAARLFVVKRATGGSAAYEGLSLHTPAWDEGPRQSHWLQDGRLQSAYLNPAPQAAHLYRLPLPAFTPRLRLLIQPCRGYLRLHILKDERLLRKATVSSLQAFVITNLSPGILKVKVLNHDNDAKVFKIWASRHASRDPFPQLPEDASLKALDGTRTCSSVHIQWLPAKGHLKYCLYRKLEADDYFKRLILEEEDECGGPDPSWDLHRCLINAVAPNLPYAPLLSAKVEGLAPGRMYRFDLLASPIRRSSAQTVSYRTLWIKTKANC